MERETELPHRIMEDMGKDLAVTVIARIPRKASAREVFPDRHERGVLTVGHGAVSLNKERMACIKIDRVVRVLSSLGKDDLCLEGVLV